MKAYLRLCLAIALLMLCFAGVTFDNSGQAVVVDGLTLTQQGIKVRLEGALTSGLLLFRAI